MNPSSLPFRELLERMDYRSIVAEPRVPAYWSVRAHVTLGQYEAADQALAALPEGFEKKFLRLQLALFRREDLGQSRSDLQALLAEVPPDSVLRGELHFILGYFHLLVDEYRQSLRHHRLAAEQYELSRLPSHLASCWFNLCVGYQNLNQRDALEAYSSLLARLAKDKPIPAIRHLSSRRQAYWAIDNENYEAALPALDEAISICRSENRWRDIGGLVCAKAYVLLRLEKEEAFDALLSDSPQDDFTAPHRRALVEFLHFREIGLPSAREAEKLLVRWKKAEIDSSYHLYLIHCLTEALRRSGAYDQMLKLARFGSRFSLAKQQALTLVDFRYLEALGLFKTGQKEKASRLLNAYRDDAIEVNATQKIAVANQLLSQIGDGESRLTKMTLNAERHKLNVNGREIDLVDHPVLYRFLLILFRNPQAMPLSEVFEKLYDTPFNPECHQSRFNALMERTRKLLGGGKNLLRRDGKIGFAPTIRATLETEVGRSDSAPVRRARLARLIRETHHPVAISDLEPLFEEGRRSLQLDLKHLLAAGVIHRAGSTRNRRYFVETGK